ncbi:hypothetical protein FNV43_RR00575 [Rhamnella rubrinervis]|uniref:DUF4218 domain-containing protein n=1 Tax=Rhamnella rubrinervis TaxID=2594499 RepID=A0A8K0MRJ2_9ROSA|nr:hypothetical protein FNV43_RR00575 [Rhamnella rubrinervis]
MYPIERALGTYKSYVKNKARSEGSIAEAYIVNESLTFCFMYFCDIETKFNRPERNFDDNDKVGDASIFKHRMKALHSQRAFEAIDDLYSLACKPDIRVFKYTACIVDGVRFTVKDCDDQLIIQNNDKIEEDQSTMHDAYQANNLNEFSFDIDVEVNEQQELHRVDVEPEVVQFVEPSGRVNDDDIDFINDDSESETNDENYNNENEDVQVEHDPSYDDDERSARLQFKESFMIAKLASSYEDTYPKIPFKLAENGGNYVS